MEAPNPISVSFIKKELTSEQGHKCSLQISFINDKFEFIVEKIGKLIKDKFRKDYTMSQIQENNYFKMFENPKEIIEELNEKIVSKSPILTETENNSMKLIIFLQNSKFRQVEFCLMKENLDLKKDSEDLRSIIDMLYNTVEKLKISNEELRKENKEIKLQLEKLEGKSFGGGITKPEDIPKKISNFFWINKEVDIVNSSTFCPKYSADSMLGKLNGSYALADGDKNHFVEFSFNNTYFLKMIRISVDQKYECNLKDFKVEVISPEGERINLGIFERSRYEDNTGFEKFEINYVCKGLKLYLINSWGEYGGKYIIIKRIDFLVSKELKNYENF